VTQQQSGIRNREYVRKLPRLTQEQIIAASRQQARQEADPSYSGHSAGIHPEHRPYMSTELSHIPVRFDAEGEYELEEDDAYYQTRLPTSARRYQGYAVSPEEVYQSGNTRYHVRYVDVPKRKSRQAQLPPPRQRERYTEEVETTLPAAKPRKRGLSTMFIFGVGMIAMLALVVLVFSASNWIQTTKDDLTYGRPRTFHIDYVVGHNDSPGNPTHFIALNLNRHVQVIEIPGQDTTKERTFQITTLFGDGEDLTPVTLSFRDVNADGKPDMLIHIHDTTVVMINGNGTFRPSKPGEVKGLV
jgi:hypothetical protein